ncbi:MAG: hypothetical protein N3A60_03685 [Thermanaerothrix sp.]|nr:hypothetical protein [Thermanaerothrix sp.]
MGPKGEGTEGNVNITYTLPDNALGRIANRFLAKRKQERAIEQTLENLKLLCEERTIQRSKEIPL